MIIKSFAAENGNCAYTQVDTSMGGGIYVPEKGLISIWDCDVKFPVTNTGRVLRRDGANVEQHCLVALIAEACELRGFN